MQSLSNNNPSNKNNSNNNIFITGGSGLLASNWINLLKNDHQVITSKHVSPLSIAGVTSINLKFDDVDSILNILDQYNIGLVINTIALTDIEHCEREPSLAHFTHVVTAKNIALACNKAKIKLVHISTDHLFDGTQSYYSETDTTAPLNCYAKTKLEGEFMVLDNCPDALVIRTNFYGWGSRHRQSFSDVILTALKKRETIHLFNDVFYTPILIDELIENTHALLKANHQGIFNVTSSERLSKYEFGMLLAKAFELDQSLIKLGSIANMPHLVARPADMSLSNLKLRSTLKKNTNHINLQINTLKLSSDRPIL